MSDTKHITYNLDFISGDVVQSFTYGILHVSKSSAATDTRTGLNNYSSIRPFATIQAAINAGASGDLVWIHPGTYAEFITLHDQINLHFDSGASVVKQRVNSGDAIFTDGGNSVSCKISGYGLFFEYDFSNNHDTYGLSMTGGGTIILYCESISGDGWGVYQSSGILTVYGDVLGNNYGAHSDNVADQTIFGDVSVFDASAQQQVALCSGTSQYIVGNITSTIVSGALCNQGTQTVIGNISSAVMGPAASCQGGTQVVKGDCTSSTDNGASVGQSCIQYITGNVTGVGYGAFNQGYQEIHGNVSGAGGGGAFSSLGTQIINGNVDYTGSSSSPGAACYGGVQTIRGNVSALNGNSYALIGGKNSVQVDQYIYGNVVGKFGTELINNSGSGTNLIQRIYGDITGLNGQAIKVQIGTLYVYNGVIVNGAGVSELSGTTVGAIVLTGCDISSSASPQPCITFISGATSKSLTIYGTTFHPNAGASNAVTTGAGAVNVKIAHCRSRLTIEGASVTNLIGTNYNIVDSDV